MFERGRQTKKFTTNVPKILYLNRLSNRYFRKIDVGCPLMVSFVQLRFSFSTLETLRMRQIQGGVWLNREGLEPVWRRGKGFARF